MKCDIIHIFRYSGNFINNLFKSYYVCDPLVNVVLLEQKQKVSEALVSAEEYMNKLDRYCGNRFEWVKKKEAFISSCPHIDLSAMIENGENKSNGTV